VKDGGLGADCVIVACWLNCDTHFLFFKSYV
jgi:hypothetical protein